MVFGVWHATSSAWCVVTRVVNGASCGGVRYAKRKNGSAEFDSCFFSYFLDIFYDTFFGTLWATRIVHIKF